MTEPSALRGAGITEDAEAERCAYEEKGDHLLIHVVAGPRETRTICGVSTLRTLVTHDLPYHLTRVCETCWS